jgi:hypothetical protein
MKTQTYQYKFYNHETIISMSHFNGTTSDLEKKLRREAEELGPGWQVAIKRQDGRLCRFHDVSYINGALTDA